ncbi:uncharacterized protein LOC143183401 [Calliopsis andreniformis]|uniref:uncharacterized protein LOC143183401 n=1 Tax=Calliopsis andreniformis TaxID=337506 RepID=UPI003FCC59D3
MSSFAAIRQKVINIIKKFKFEELESSVLPVFPELSWIHIKSQLIKYDKSFTTTNALEFIKIAVNETNIEEEVLRDRLSTLLLIDISWHNKRYTWHGYALIGPNPPKNYFKNAKILDNIKNHLKSVNMKMDVKIYVHDSIMYISITESTKRGKKESLINRPPIVFALLMRQKYFFCNKKNVPSTVTEAIVKNIGYKNSKKLDLVGKDLSLLSKVCWRKKEKTTNVENFDVPLVYEDTNPIKKYSGIDYTEYNQRKEFAKKCFGNDSPTLGSLVINGPSIPFIHKDASLKLPNESMSVTWEFRSRNMPACLTKLIEKRILTTPVPYYISNLMTIGKNQFTLKST